MIKIFPLQPGSRLSEPGSRFSGTGRKTSRQNSFHINGNWKVFGNFQICSCTIIQRTNNFYILKKQLSKFLHLQTFLGQKYGYRPFPPKIPETEFNRLLKAVVDEEDSSTLQAWFQLDSNAVPKEYILQPITSILPNYRNQSNPDLRKAASREWWSCFERMQMALRKSAVKILDKAEQQKYLMSGKSYKVSRNSAPHK